MTRGEMARLLIEKYGIQPSEIENLTLSLLYSLLNPDIPDSGVITFNDVKALEKYLACQQVT
jgi:hypothetical protein